MNDGIPVSCAPGPATHHEFVTFRLADQWLGVPVMLVQEVLVAMRIASVPMAPAAIAGFLNLRGQIVTAIDLRVTLQLEPRPAGSEIMNLVVQHDGELFALMVDDVGDVVSVEASRLEAPPATLDGRWRTACSGIVRRERGLLLVMNVHDVLRREYVSG